MERNNTASSKRGRDAVLEQFTQLALDDLDMQNDDDFLSSPDTMEMDDCTNVENDESDEEKKVVVESKVPFKKLKADPKNVDTIDSEPTPGTSKPSKEYLQHLEEEDSGTETLDNGGADWFWSTQETDESVEAVLSELETFYREERGLVVRKDGLISTPLHAVKQIAGQYNEAIHSEVTVIQNVEGKELVRMEIFVGAFRGLGEAFTKRLAAQMAAIDALKKMGELDGTGVVESTPYCIYPGWRIKPHVFNDLVTICRKHNLKFPRYVSTTNIDNPEVPMYSVECLVGEQTMSIGISDLSNVARKLAAYQTIEVLTGLKCPLEYVAMGSTCHSYKKLVEMGCKPLMSDTKKKWLLEENPANSVENALRGIDDDEMAALKKEALDHDFQKVLKRKTKGMSVTVDVRSDRRSFGFA